MMRLEMSLKQQGIFQTAPAIPDSSMMMQQGSIT